MWVGWVRPGLLAGVAGLVLSGCGSSIPERPASLDSTAAEISVTRGEGIDPDRHAGEFEMKTATAVPAQDRDLPFALYVGLSAEDETRLSIRSLVDLRQVQAELPDLLTGTIEDTCNVQVTLDFDAADARDDSLRAWGTAHARLFRCRGEESDIAARGFQYLGATVDAYAEASAEVADDCVVVQLRDIRLYPRGFLGGVANLFGLTGIARSVILERGETYLSENPICAELPPELASLQPRYESGGPLEIGAGGMGAELAGSVDVSAQTLIGLLALVQKNGLLEDLE